MLTLFAGRQMFALEDNRDLYMRGIGGNKGAESLAIVQEEGEEETDSADRVEELKLGDQ